MFLWLGSMLLYSALPYYMVPMTSLMQASYGDVSLMKIPISRTQVKNK
ncbi:Uncharacterised protein [Streptococcus pneumoniae]|nr:Uncharacterised protein [Streptococcus pneumoniae]